MECVGPEHVELDDPARVAAVMATLSLGRHALKLRLEGDDDPREFEIERLNVSAAEGLMTLALAAALFEPTWIEREVSLQADDGTESLHFSGFDGLAIVSDEQSPVLQCKLPRRLHAVNKRSAVRMPFLAGMPARVSLHLFHDQAPVRARIVDMSIGGCLLELSLDTGMLLKVGQPVLELCIEFPSGERLVADATVRHVRLGENGPRVQGGVEFVSLQKEQQQKLWFWLREIECEIALRKGQAGRMAQRSELFVFKDGSAPGTRGRGKLPPSTLSTPMVPALHEVVRDLGAAVLTLRNDQPLPIATLSKAADTLCELLESDRQQFLYALCCLTDQPLLFQHSIAVAGRLIDLVRDESQLSPRLAEIALAALIHDLGKALLLDESLPALYGEMTSQQKTQMRRHVDVLLASLGDDCDNWLGAEVRREVIGGINERLDGSGYPGHLAGGEIGALARAAAVVDVIDAITRPREDRTPQTPLAIYREIYNLPDRFDRNWVTRYVQRHGFYPIGSLVHYSRGFLAWVMALDERGQPERIRVVVNLHRREINMSDIISRSDITQLGKLTGPALPQRYDLAPY